MKLTFANYFKNLMVEYFSLNGYLLPQADAEQGIRDGVSFRGINMLILITAIFIASLGLNTNSTAVIIGAMLISPLMGPIIGIGYGIGVYDFEFIKRCIRNLGMATIFSVLTSTLYFLISPVSEGHSELLARTSPTIYDVLIGFFGGAAGILAVGSKFKGNVIPGVAIATALMPPLCTAGYGLATWQMHYFFGAFYLYLINSVYIALATFLGVKAMKWTAKAQINAERSKRVRRLVYIISVVVLLPSIYLTWSMLRQNDFAMRATRFVNSEFRFPDTQVLSHRAYFDGSERVISVTLIGQVLPADSLKLAMAPRLKHFGLQGANIEIIQGSNAAQAAPGSDTSVRDVYQLAQSTITRQQTVIDSLRAVNALRQAADTVSATIAPELKVLFPEVADIAVSTNVFGSVATQRLDTVNVVLVKYNRYMTPTQEKKFREYLIARLHLKELSLVDVGSSIQFPAKK